MSGLSPNRRARLIAAALFSPEFRREHPERVEELLRYFFSHRAQQRGRLLHWWASVYHDTAGQLRRIDAPTLILHGGADRLVPPANAELLGRMIPDAEVAIVEGAGHAYLWEQPDQARARVEEWLDRRDPILAGPPLSGIAAYTEPVTRAAGLATGAFRTGRSLFAARRGER